MDKNTLVGFILIGAVLIGFSIYNRPSQEEMERARRYQDSIQTIAQQEAAKLDAEAAAKSTQALTLFIKPCDLFELISLLIFKFHTINYISTFIVMS